MQASARKCCRAYAAPLLLPRAQNFFDVALDLGTRQHDLMPAALAFDLEIHAYAQYIETVRTAGVRLLGLDDVPRPVRPYGTPPFFQKYHSYYSTACVVFANLPHKSLVSNRKPTTNLIRNEEPKMLEYRAEGLCRNANHLSREELSRCMGQRRGAAKHSPGLRHRAPPAV